MLNPVPLDQAAGWLDAHCAAVGVEDVAAARLCGRVLACTVAAEGDQPPAALAAVDGYALDAAATVGASDYNPLSFTVDDGNGDVPGTGRVSPVASGDRLPAGADTVMPLEGTELRRGILEVYAPLASGDHVIRAGREARSGDEVLGAGRVLRPADIALLTSLGRTEATVVRRPRVRIVLARADVTDASGVMVAALVDRDGGEPAALERSPANDLGAALAGRGDDLVLVVGASGCGSNDHAVAALAQAGTLACRGVAINPGETTTLGLVADKPVAILPGPPLGALFGYDLVARRALTRLAGRSPELPYDARRAVLARKIASGLGRLECCRVRVESGVVEPIAVSDSRNLSTAVRADGFVLVPEHSEGFAEGAEVTVYMYDE